MTHNAAAHMKRAWIMETQWMSQLSRVRLLKPLYVLGQMSCEMVGERTWRMKWYPRKPRRISWTWYGSVVRLSLSANDLLACTSREGGGRGSRISGLVRISTIDMVLVWLCAVVARIGIERITGIVGLHVLPIYTHLWGAVIRGSFLLCRECLVCPTLHASGGRFA
jgi:hypothetical protein